VIDRPFQSKTNEKWQPPLAGLYSIRHVQAAVIIYYQMAKFILDKLVPVGLVSKKTTYPEELSNR
jgi:hypothetical protein